MRIRIREPAGQVTLTLPDTSTVNDLQVQITEKTSLSAFDLKYGYPPKPLRLEEHEKNTPLSQIDINLDGEQLIVSRRYEGKQLPNPLGEQQHPEQGVQENASKLSGPSRAPVSSSSSFADFGTTPPLAPALPRGPDAMNKDAPEISLPTHASTLILRVMPDDNSCLFRAFNTAFFGAMDNILELRAIIAQSIQANQDKYSAVVLDKSPDDYCRWIQTDVAWGGAIELDILSRYFDIEICSIGKLRGDVLSFVIGELYASSDFITLNRVIIIDVQTLRMDKFNEGNRKRCILVYSGIHYDCIALSSSNPPSEHAIASPDFDTKIYDVDDVSILTGALELCRILQARHYYTDTANFSVRCNTCGLVFVGENGATAHAKKTGHMDFGEAN